MIFGKVWSWRGVDGGRALLCKMDERIESGGTKGQSEERGHWLCKLQRKSVRCVVRSKLGVEGGVKKAGVWGLAGEPPTR